MPLLLVGAILQQVTFLLTPETPPFAHQLAPLHVDLHLGICPPRCVPAPSITWSVVLLDRR